MLGFHLPSQSKKKLPMELNPGEGGTLSGYLQKKKAREDAKKITEQKMGKATRRGERPERYFKGKQIHGTG